MRALLLLSLLLVLSPSGVAFSGSPTAREIMQRVDARDDGDRQIMDIEMILIDKNGKKRIRKLRSFVRDVGEDSQQLLFFLSPADVKNTGFLTYDYDEEEKDDEQWLYLPALHKTKRIASNDKSKSFMGSDFSYADMTSLRIDSYDYTLMKETDVRGHKAWQIQAIPRTEEEIERTGYTKSVLFVRQDNAMVVRAVYWLKKGNRLKYLDVKRLEQIDGIWIGTEVHMTTKKGGVTRHRTVIKNRNVRFGQPLDEALFTTRRLERGPD